VNGPGAGGAGTAIRAATAAFVAGLGLALAACGGPATSGPQAVPGTTTLPLPAAVVVTTPTASAPAPTGRSILPDLAVDDVAGGTLNLTSLAPAPRPVLLWFWAPT
jgi:hypothetical protein